MQNRESRKINATGEPKIDVGKYVGFKWCAILLLALALIIGFTPCSRSGHPPELPHASEARSATQDPLTLLTQPPSAHDFDAINTSGVKESASGVREARQPVPLLRGTNKSAEIRGRFVLGRQSPAPGVRLQMHGWGEGREALPQSDQLPWRDIVGKSDSDGRFSIAFDPPPEFQFRLEAELPGYPTVYWRWLHIEAGTTVDVGELTLYQGGTIEGYIVDANGCPLRGEEWTVHVRSVRPGGVGSNRYKAEVKGVVAPGSGDYRIEGVMPGEVTVRAYSPLAGWIGASPFLLLDGERRQLDIVYAGPSNGLRITIRTASPKLPIMDPPSTEFVILLGEDAHERTAVRLQGSPQTYTFSGVDPGRYIVKITDPRYLCWQSGTVRPGESLVANLEGSAALQLSVEDRQGNLIKNYSTSIKFLDVDAPPHEFVAQPVQGLISGMFPGSYEIHVGARSMSGDLFVDGLQAGEKRSLRVVVR